MKRLIIFILVLAIIAFVGYKYHRIKLRLHYIDRRMACGTNLSSPGRTMLIYSHDYGNKLFPTTSKWCDLLIEHADVTEKSLRCPGASEGPCNYAMNKNVEKLGIYSLPAVVVLFETHPGWNQFGGPEILTTNNHQGKGCNVLFADWRVKFVKTEDLYELKWDIENNEAEKP